MRLDPGTRPASSDAIAPDKLPAPAGDCRGAEILLFTGVRYERHPVLPDTPEGTSAGSTRRRG